MYKTRFILLTELFEDMGVTKASKKRDELNIRKKIQNYEGISHLGEHNFHIIVIFFRRERTGYSSYSFKILIKLTEKDVC